jgi:hypothetical protein
MLKYSGECLCGNISYECDVEPIMAAHCQCTDCQKISGSGHIANLAFPLGHLSIDGEMTFHEKLADSGNMVKRGFCPNCGSHIYAVNTGMPEVECIRAGSLHNPELFKPSMVVYASSSTSWDYMDPALVKCDLMPTM